MRVKKIFLAAVVLMFISPLVFATMSQSELLASVTAPNYSQEKLRSCTGEEQCEINLSNEEVSFVQPPQPTISSHEVVLNASQPSGQIILAANPTTGYDWSAENYDSDLLQLTRQYISTAQPGLVGAGGKEVWTIQATEEALKSEPKTLSVTFIYHRAWEKNVTPAKTEVVSVQIN